MARLEKGRSRRVGAILAIGCLALGVVAAAASASSQHRAGARATTLTIAMVNNSDMIVMQSLVSDFTKKTGVKVKFVTLPENTLRQKVTSDVATGGGQFDIATVGTYDVPIWAKNKWLVSLAPYFAKLGASASKAYDLADVIPKVRLGLSYQNQLYALPFYGESS
ncbi:MAG: polyol transport system substrate-binding protein, partial [Gaiellales bacterium]|nr:polyol transport system substrate-binding protein [Gaiellales bacterium]